MTIYQAIFAGLVAWVIVVMVLMLFFSGVNKVKGRMKDGESLERRLDDLEGPDCSPLPECAMAACDRCGDVHEDETDEAACVEFYKHSYEYLSGEPRTTNGGA